MVEGGHGEERNHPGRYITDERAFVQLYAEHFGHPPYKLVVVNVSYGLGPETPWLTPTSS